MSEHDVAPGDKVVITDMSLNLGDMHGRSAVLEAIRYDEDGYDYQVSVTDTIGLVLWKGEYRTWVSSVQPADTAAYMGITHHTVEQ
ncbi:hypothetical protein OG473_39700 (plasmid) [Streptomyces anulatus]|uniref:hypothetical protein n=1 Tax=Streptomyces anulatus TaxID=1892 RepID=UPI00324E181A